MNYLLTHWRGQLSVTKAVWLSGLLAWLVTLPVGYVEFHNFLIANHASGISDLIDRAQNGEMPSADTTPIWLQACDLALAALTFVWWAVGTWRSCDNPVNQKATTKKYRFLKLTIIIMAAFTGYDLFDFVTKLAGG